MKKEYKPLGEFLVQTDELKKLIAEHPDHQIIVTCGSEVVGDGGYSWYAPDLSFALGEILDCEQDIVEGLIYTDRGEFRDDIESLFAFEEEYDSLTEEEFEKAVQEEYDKYEPYWKNVIVIHADV